MMTELMAEHKTTIPRICSRILAGKILRWFWCKLPYRQKIERLGATVMRRINPSIGFILAVMVGSMPGCRRGCKAPDETQAIRSIQAVVYGIAFDQRLLECPSINDVLQRLDFDRSSGIAKSSTKDGPVVLIYGATNDVIYVNSDMAAWRNITNSPSRKRLAAYLCIKTDGGEERIVGITFDFRTCNASRKEAAGYFSSADTFVPQSDVGTRQRMTGARE